MPRNSLFQQKYTNIIKMHHVYPFPWMLVLRLTECGDGYVEAICGSDIGQTMCSCVYGSPDMLSMRACPISKLSDVVNKLRSLQWRRIIVFCKHVCQTNDVAISVITIDGTCVGQRRPSVKDQRVSAISHRSPSHSKRIALDIYTLL
jgi:hypothetical protein